MMPPISDVERTINYLYSAACRQLVIDKLKSTKNGELSEKEKVYLRNAVTKAVRNMDRKGWSLDLTSVSINHETANSFTITVFSYHP
jgi:hypothetical protein